MTTTVKHPIRLTTRSFEQEVLKNSRPVVVDFWAEWCGPCRLMGSMLEELVGEDIGERVIFAKVNVDEHPDLASHYGIQSIPTLVIFKDGEILDRIVGAVPKKALMQRLDMLTTST